MQKNSEETELKIKEKILKFKKKKKEDNKKDGITKRRSTGIRAKDNS